MAYPVIDHLNNLATALGGEDLFEAQFISEGYVTTLNTEVLSQIDQFRDLVVRLKESPSVPDKLAEQLHKLLILNTTGLLSKEVDFATYATAIDNYKQELSTIALLLIDFFENTVMNAFESHYGILPSQMSETEQFRSELSRLRRLHDRVVVTDIDAIMAMPPSKNSLESIKLLKGILSERPESQEIRDTTNFILEARSAHQEAILKLCTQICKTFYALYLHLRATGKNRLSELMCSCQDITAGYIGICNLFDNYLESAKEQFGSKIVGTAEA